MTKEEILNNAKIARILISDVEAKQFTKELNDILKFVEMINEVDLEEKYSK